MLNKYYCRVHIFMIIKKQKWRCLLKADCGFCAAQEIDAHCLYDNVKRYLAR